MNRYLSDGSVSIEYIPCIDFIPDILQAAVITVCNDAVTDPLEFLQVSDDLIPKESGTGFQGRLIDHDLRPLGPDPLHDALDGGLAA